MKINKLLKSAVFVSCLVVVLSCVVAAYGEYPEPNFWWNTGYDFVGNRTNQNFTSPGFVGQSYSSEVALNFASSMYISRWIRGKVYIFRGSMPPGLKIEKTAYGVKIS